MIICALRHRVVPSGMYADAMTKKNGNVPLLQMLMRTGRIFITEESVTLEKHKLNPSSRSSSSKTRVDPVTQAVMDAQPKIDRYLLMDVRVSV